jgi:citrate lyase subunit beta/citryl-CoA lyase
VKHPRDILLGSQAASMVLPVCDHYSGVELRMRKSLQLQAEIEHAHLVQEIANAAAPEARVAVRVHPVDHPSFFDDVELIVGRGHSRLRHVMIPKVESLADVETAAKALNHVGALTLPLHVLIESPAAVHRAFEIAAHPRVQSVSFGLMDFVSAHGGAIPASGMGVKGQFTHPLVLRAKLEIASACHANGKVPSHCVVTEFSDLNAIKVAATQASRELGFTRMWSIHPSQIRPVVEALAPSEQEIEQAAELISAAQAAEWAPVSHAGQLHDRASYRFFWQVLERACQTGRRMPASVQSFFGEAACAT